MPDLTGQSIGRYHILKQVGEGGMATVYKAYDTRLERSVALKVLRTDLFGSAIIEQILKRFEREAKSLAKLSHPNIVKILDYGEHEGSPYLVMEYLPGGTLKQKLGQAIHWKEAIQILLPIARGLAYAHHENIIHRDIKPANILMDNLNAPILTDFGIAKLLEGADGHTLTASGVGIGTPEYMAPEQGIGASTIDARADIYSLGIVLYEMVTGRKPYIADTPMAVVLKQINDPLPRPTDFVPDLPESVEHILLKALAKQPEDRYEDMNALIAAMESALTDVYKTAASAPLKYKKKKAKLPLKSGQIFFGAFSAIAIIILGSIVIPRMGDFFNPSSSTTLRPTSTKTLTPTPTSTSNPISTSLLLPALINTPDSRILNPENQHLYMYVRLETFWNTAKDYCASHGSHLVTIANSSENTFVSQLANTEAADTITYVSWLGATDEVKEGDWVWVTGEPWGYANWDKGEPDNNCLEGVCDYLTLSRFGKTWSDNTTDSAINKPPGFICEWEPNS